MRKKIIFFHPYSVYGGADLSISKLIDSTPSNYKIDFVTFSKNPKIKHYTKKKFRVIKINNIFTIFAILRLRNFIKTETKKFDKVVLLSNQNFANIIALFSTINLEKVKKILFERNHISELDLDNADTLIIKIKRKLIKFLIKYTYRFSDIIIGNSKELCKDLRLHCKTKIKNLYNFYNFSDLKKKSSLKIKKKLKFKDNIIINVGRLVDQKNQIFLLKSFKILNDLDKKINLLLIGNGNKKKEITDYIIRNKLSKNVQILSNIKNALPYIKMSDLYVSTSKYEGFPNVIIEALVLDTPVISIKYKSGLTEILLNGKGALLIKRYDQRYLAKKILNFYKNKKILKEKLILSKKSLYRFNYEIGQQKFKKIINNL